MLSDLTVHWSRNVSVAMLRSGGRPGRLCSKRTARGPALRSFIRYVRKWFLKSENLKNSRPAIRPALRHRVCAAPPSPYWPTERYILQSQRGADPPPPPPPPPSLTHHPRLKWIDKNKKKIFSIGWVTCTSLPGPKQRPPVRRSCPWWRPRGAPGPPRRCPCSLAHTDLLSPSIET